MRNQPWAATGSIFGLLGVAVGAFGAHGLKGHLEPALLAVFEVGVRYQLYHALALVILGSLPLKGRRQRLRQAAGWSFTSGILLFSGSLYALALSSSRILGAITPLGGLLLLLGWALLALIFLWRDSEEITE